MKYIAIIAVMMTLAVPAFAQEDAVRPVIAKASADQRALAQLIAGRIQTSLDAEPFVVEKDCKAGHGCTASAQ